jgi:hypothetical protein
MRRRVLVGAFWWMLMLAAMSVRADSEEAGPSPSVLDAPRPNPVPSISSSRASTTPTEASDAGCQCDPRAASAPLKRGSDTGGAISLRERYQTGVAVMLVLLLGLAWLLYQFGRALEQGATIGVRGHWGGFGGAGSGWEISPALGLLIAIALLTAALCAFGQLAGAAGSGAAQPSAATESQAPSQAPSAVDPLREDER